MQTSIKKYDFKAGLPHEFEIIDLSVLHSSFTLFTAPYRTNFYHIFWVHAGNPIFVVDFIPVRLKPDSFLFLSKDTVLKLDPKNGFTGKVIIFTDSFFCRSENDRKFLKNTALFDTLSAPIQIQLSNRCQHLSTLVNDMILEVEREQDVYQGKLLHNLLYNLLLLSEREKLQFYSPSIKKDISLDHVILFKDLLEAGFRANKHVAHYAAKMMVTERKLGFATHKILGKSPKEVIDERVMLEAKRILVNTAESVKEVSFELGFEEPTNFVKYFRKHQRTTPTEFRNAIQSR